MVRETPLPTSFSGVQAAGTPGNKIPSSLIYAAAASYATTFHPKPISSGVVGTNMIDFTPCLDVEIFRYVAITFSRSARMLTIPVTIPILPAKKKADL
jgi:hypothetical protein